MKDMKMVSCSYLPINFDAHCFVHLVAVFYETRFNIVEVNFVDSECC